MRNRQVAIDFQAKGIDEIIKELDKLQRQANDVTLAKGLESQFSSLAEQADSLKTALTELKSAFTEEPKKRDNKELSSMEKKIKEVKEAVSKLTHDLATENAKIDATMAKMETAVDKMNDPKAFNGLLNQINLVQKGFDSLIEQVKDFRELLSTPINIEPKAVAREGKKVSSTKQTIEKEIRELKALMAEDQEDVEKAQSMSTKELKNLLSGMDARVGTLQQERKGKSKEVQTQINREIYKILKSVDMYLDTVDMSTESDEEDFGSVVSNIIDGKLINLQNAMKANIKMPNGKKMSEYRILEKVIGDRVKELEAQLKTTKVEVDDESRTEVTNGITSLISTVTDLTTKKQKVFINVGVAEDAQSKVEADLNSIIKTINDSNPHIDIKLNFVSGPTVKNRKLLIDKLEEEVKKLSDNGEISDELKKLIPKIDKQLKGDLYLEVGSNIEKLKESFPGALKAMRHDIEQNPINANVVINKKDIQDQINKLGTLTLPIGKVEISKDIINHTDVEKTLEEVQQEFAEAQQGIKKEAEQSNPAEEYAQSVARFVRDVQKIPSILNGLKKSIGVVDIDGNLIVDPNQIHDAIQNALDQLEDLHVKISRIDMNQPTIDKLKLDVKSDTLNLIQVEKLMITEMRALSNNLFPVLRSMAGEQPSGQPKNAYDIAVKALKDLSTFIDRVSKQYGLVDDTAKQAEKTSKEKFQDYVNNRKQKQEEQSKNTQPEEPINVIKTDVSSIANDVAKIASQVSKDVASSSVKATENATSDVLMRSKSITDMILENRPLPVELRKADPKVFPKEVDDIESSNSENLARQTSNYSNGIAKTVRGWAQAGIIMNQMGYEDRERTAVGNLTNGAISNSFVVGNEDNIAHSIAQGFREALGPDFDLHIHYHGDNIIAPSHEGGDLAAYRVKDEKQGLIVGRKQSMLINREAISDNDYQQITSLYAKKDSEKYQNDNTYNRYKYFYQKYGLLDDLDRIVPTFSELSNKLQHNFVKSATNALEPIYKRMYGLSFGDFEEDDINELRRKLTDTELDENGVKNILKEILANINSWVTDRVGNEELSHAIDSEGYMMAMTDMRFKAALRESKAYTADSYLGKDKANDAYQELLQELLKDSFAEINPKINGNRVDYSDFIKILNHEDPSSLPLSAINDFLGIKNTNATYLSDIAEYVRQIVILLNSSDVSLLSKSPQMSSDDVTLGKLSPTNKTSTGMSQSKWYTGWNQEQAQKRTTHAKALSSDLQKFKANNEQGDMSDLEYSQIFYNEYLEFLEDDLAKASKKQKLSKKNYIKFVKEQQQFNQQQIDLEKQKNNLIEQEVEAERQANQLLKGREDRQDELAKQIAKRQAYEYAQEQKKADDEVSKSKATGRKQAESEYISNKTRQTTLVSRLAQMETLSGNEFLDGDARKRVEDMVARLNTLKDSAYITKVEFADIKKECSEITREAQKNIDTNKAYNAQLKEQDRLYKQALEESQKARQEQQKLHQQAVEQQRKENQLQNERNNEINKMVLQAKALRGQQGVSTLTQGMLDDFIHKLRLVQQQGKIAEGVVGNLNGELKTLSKQAGGDISTVKRQAEQQARQSENENKSRMRSVDSMATSLSDLLNNKDFAQRFHQPVEDLLSNLKQIQTQGQIAEDVFNAIATDYKQINDQAKIQIADQKQINDLIKKLNFLTTETNADGNKYTQDYLNRVSDMIHRLENGQATFDEGNGLLHVSSNAENMVASSKSLNNYVIKGQKLITQNYMPGDLKRQFEDLVKVMQKFSVEGGHSKAEVNGLIGSFQKLEIEAAKAGKSLWGQIGQRLQDMNAKFIATYFSFMDIIRYMRSMISTITELDTALTEMRKVSDESLSSLKEYQKTTFDTAGVLGTTAVQLQQSTADWLRLGESMEEASKSAKAATTLFNVSEFENVNEATTALVAMSQAYKDLDKTEIIDVMNNIGNNYSIATDQLATALQASASSLMVQGNDLYEAAALVTAGNAVIQDANKVGAGLRTISLRIAGVKEGDDDIKEELEELGEEVDEWVVSTQAKKRQVILDYTKTAANGGQGVDILDSNGNLRDTYHILLDIAKVYKDIQEEDKKYGTNRAKGLVEELAGKNRSNIAASILMNPELLENVYESALSSAGSAAEENAKYLDSIVGKTQQFKNELQELESNVLDGEIIKDVIDFGTTFLSVLNKIGDKLPVVIGLIGSLALGIGSVKKMGTGNLFMDTEQNKLVYKNQDVFKNIREKGVVSGIFSSLTGAGGGIDAQGIGATERGFNLLAKGVDFSNEKLEIFYNRLEEVGNAEVNFDSVLESMGNLDDETVQMAQDLKEQGVYSLDELQVAEQETGAAAQVAAVGVEIFSMAVRALAAAAVMAAFSLLVKLIKDAANASEDATREMKEFVDAVQQTRKELKEQKDFINEVGEEYDQLSKGVDDLGNNISLSADEFERYKTISNEIGDRFPEMIQGWTDQKDAIIATKDAVKALNDEYEKEARRKWAKYIDEGDLEKLSKSWYQINHANPFEQITTVFTGSTKAGVYDTYDRLEELYSTFLDMSYEEFKDFWNNGEYGSFAITDNQKILSKYSGNMNLLGFENLTEVTEENFQQARIKANAGLDAIRSDLDEQLNGWREAGQGLLDYNLLINDKEINKENREAISSIINNIDKDFIDSIDGDSDAFMSYVSDLVNIFENVNSDALAEIFQSVDTEKSYNQVVEDFDKAWSRVDEEFQRKIAESTTEAEKQKYREARNELFQASGGADLYEYQNRFDEYLRSLSQSGKEYEYLKGVTKDFSQTQMEAWYKETDAIYSATENVRRYEESLKKVEKQKYKDIGALLSQNTYLDSYLPEPTTSWKDIKDDLIGMAQAGKLDEQTLKDYEYFNDILEELGLSSEEAEEHITDMVNAINRMAVNNPVDDLANYRTEMDKLGDAYSKYKNGEFIDANTLSALQDAFGDLDSYQEFEKAVLTGDENLQEHFDNIVSEYAQVHQVLGNLTDDEKEYYKQMLIRSGISKESAEKAVEEASQHNKVIRGRIQLAIEDANTTAVQEQQLKKLVLSTDELDKATLKEVNDLITATGITGEAAEMIKYYAIQKDLAKHKDMRNDDDINYLLQVAEMAGIASASITALKHLSDQSADFKKDIGDANAALEKYQGKAYINPAEQQEINRLIAKRDTAQNALDNMGKYADQAFDEVWDGFQSKFEQYQYTPNLDYGGVVSDASDAGSAAGESFKEALDKILAMYDAELDAGVVSFQTYVDKSRAIIQQYYNDGKIKASEYYDYLANLYEKQVSEYDKVISAVQRKLKEQTDELEKQKEAIEESYNTQIEEIQAKIDALQDENDEIEKNIALQKAQ